MAQKIRFAVIRFVFFLPMLLLVLGFVQYLLLLL